MKVTIERGALLKALKTVKLGSQKTPPREKFFYDAVVIAIEPGSDTVIRLTCAEPNQPKLVTTTVPVTASYASTDTSSDTFAVNVHTLLRLVSMLRGETVALDCLNPITGLVIADDACDIKVKIPTVPLDRVYAKYVKYHTPTQPAPGLLHAARRVWFAASTEPARPVLQGVCFNGSVSATDGFRIAVLPEAIDGVHGLVPAKILRLANDVFGCFTDLMVDIRDGRFAVGDGITTIETNMIEGNFPDYQVLIQNNFKLTVEFDYLDLRQALESVKAVQKANDNHFPSFNMELIQDSDKLCATVSVTGEHELSTSIPANPVFHDTELKFPFKIAFNAELLDGIIARTGCSRVQLFINAWNTPMVVRPQDASDNWYALVMPVLIW